jgi:hypothetical protein
MQIRLFLILVFLAACGRPLTEAEVGFVTRLQGGTIDTANVRLVDGTPATAITFQRPARARVTCQDRILPPSTSEVVTVKPGAVALYNRVFMRRDLFLKDYLRGYPEQTSLLAMMFFAHEMTHVWQWQNRDVTGYHPLKAASEHQQSSDPYLFDINDKARFLEFGYEQQASIVEEYLCCRALAHDAPRTQRLHALISQSMPLADLDQNILGDAVRLPWDGAEVRGICD